MNIILCMNSFESSHHRLQYFQGIFQRKTTAFAEILQKCCALDKFHNDIRRVIFLEMIENGNDIGITNKLFHSLVFIGKTF